MSTGLTSVGLVGDIDETNARFALVELAHDRPQLMRAQSLRCRDFSTPDAAVKAYLEEFAFDRRPDCAAIAVAGPVDGGTVTFTNSPWRLSEADLCNLCGFTLAKLVNDYYALALIAPLLDHRDAPIIGFDAPDAPTGTIAVVGLGTGFDVGGLVRDGQHEIVLASEGGHVGFTPVDEHEVKLWRIVKRRFGRASVERLLSGPGLTNIYYALCELTDVTPHCLDPANITAAAEAGDALALDAIDRFCVILGAVAGDIALSMNARGGVYIAGSMVPHLLHWIEASPFRERFEAKGRFRELMKTIPTRAIINPFAALFGSSQVLRQALKA